MSEWTEEELRSAADPRFARERLAAIGFVAGLVTHKARNRFALLRAALELLNLGAEHALTTEHRAELLTQLDEFLSDFNLGLEMVRCEFGQLEPVSIGETVMEAVEFFRPQAEGRGIDLTYSAGEATGEVRADRRLLRLSLLNLLRNSAEALPATASARIRVHAAAGADAVTIEVEDNGPGILPELYDRLFLEPVTGKKSTGLGLILCRDSMAAMGGSIVCATPKGATGASFKLRLPRG